MNRSGINLSEAGNRLSEQSHFGLRTGRLVALSREFRHESNKNQSTLKRHLNIVENCKNLDEKDLTKSEAYPSCV